MIEIHPTRQNCATTALRPGCRSIPAAKFRHYAELNSATKAELVDGDKARAAVLTKKRLKEIAQAVANARWTPNLPVAD